MPMWLLLWLPYLTTCLDKLHARLCLPAIGAQIVVARSWLGSGESGVVGALLQPREPWPSVTLHSYPLPPSN